jgi:hypothetical protein
LKFHIRGVGPPGVEDDIISILAQTPNLDVVPTRTEIIWSFASLKGILVGSQVQSQAVDPDAAQARQDAGHGPLFLFGKIGDDAPGGGTEVAIALVLPEKRIANTHNHSQDAHNYQKLQNRERP